MYLKAEYVTATKKPSPILRSIHVRHTVRTNQLSFYASLLCPRPHRAEAFSDDACLTSVCRVHRA